MQAINGTDSDVRLLASTLNADVNEVRSAISAIQLGIQSVGSQVGMSGLQIQNAILSGDAGIQEEEGIRHRLILFFNKILDFIEEASC